MNTFCIHILRLTQELKLSTYYMINVYICPHSPCWIISECTTKRPYQCAVCTATYILFVWPRWRGCACTSFGWQWSGGGVDSSMLMSPDCRTLYITMDTRLQTRDAEDVLRGRPTCWIRPQENRHKILNNWAVVTANKTMKGDKLLYSCY